MLSVFLGSIVVSPIHGQTTTLSGNISTITDIPMADVTIQLMIGESIFTTTTDEQGDYILESIPNLTDVQIQFTKEDDPVNGVSSLDLVLMSRHILGIAPFKTSDKYLAMDVNKSGTLTAFDFVQIRRLILGLATEFPNNDAWRFVEKGRLANITINQTDNPEYTGAINTPFSLENEDAIVLNFTGIKVGDASRNAIP